jgi:hypothetical protein
LAAAYRHGKDLTLHIVHLEVVQQYRVANTSTEWCIKPCSGLVQVSLAIGAGLVACAVLWLFFFAMKEKDIIRWAAFAMSVAFTPWVFVLLVPIIQWCPQRVELDENAGVVYFHGVASVYRMVQFHPCRELSVPVSDVQWVNNTRFLGLRVLEVKITSGVVYVYTDRPLELADCFRQLAAISHHPTYSEDRKSREIDLRFYWHFWYLFGVPAAFGVAYGVYRLLKWLF